MARLTFDFNRCSTVTMTESGSLWVARLLRTKAGYRSLQQRMEQEESELFVLLGSDAQELCSLLVRADQRLPWKGSHARPSARRPHRGRIPAPGSGPNGIGSGL